MIENKLLKRFKLDQIRIDYHGIAGKGCWKRKTCNFVQYTFLEEIAFYGVYKGIFLRTFSIKFHYSNILKLATCK